MVAGDGPQTEGPGPSLCLLPEARSSAEQSTLGHPLGERIEGKSNQAAQMIQFKQRLSSAHFCRDRWE